MKINELLPQEEKFTEVLCSIALMPKMLFYYGKIPQNRVLLRQNWAREIADSRGKQDLRRIGRILCERKEKVEEGADGEVRNLNKVGGMDAGEGAKGPGRTDGKERAKRQKSKKDKTKLPELCEDLLETRPKTVAIVGARKYTAYGADIAHRLAYDLAGYGVVIVSGLAIGIDSIAHRGALEANGCTVAVLGTAIDRIYPEKHLGLARKIVAAGGCVMSEYGKGAPTFRASFLERNRLIAGLADAVIIVEATDHSGSLNTAMHAIEQGRDLFAVPGDVTKPTSVGCNRLIMQGATPCTCAEDVLNVLFPNRRERKSRQLPLFGDNMDETKVLRAIEQGVRDGDEIVVKTEISVMKFNQTIAMLEIKGRVRRLGANQWALC